MHTILILFSFIVIKKKKNLLNSILWHTCHFNDKYFYRVAEVINSYILKAIKALNIYLYKDMSPTCFSLSLDKKPKCDRNNRAVWYSWQACGGIHSSLRCNLGVWVCILYSALVCASISLLSSSWLGSSRIRVSRLGIHLSLWNQLVI